MMLRIICDFRHLHDKPPLCFLITTLNNYISEIVFQSTADHPRIENTETFLLLWLWSFADDLIWRPWPRYFENVCIQKL